jgi:hypothetical protein
MNEDFYKEIYKSLQWVIPYKIECHGESFNNLLLNISEKKYIIYFNDWSLTK